MRGRNNILQTKFKGDEAAYRKWRTEIGRKGGSRKVKKGFAMMPKDKLHEVSVKGGQGYSKMDMQNEDSEV